MICLLEVENILKKRQFNRNFVEELKYTRSINEMYDIIKLYYPNITEPEIKTWIKACENSGMTEIQEADLADIAGGVGNFERAKAALISALIFAGGVSVQSNGNTTFAVGNSHKSSVVNSENIQKERINKFGLYAFENNKKAVEKMLAEGMDINLKDIHGRTAVVHAAIGDKLEMVKFLIAKGADVSIKDNSGKTALNYTSNPEIIEVILRKLDKNYDKKPIRVITLERYELTVRLHAAASRGDIKRVKEIFDNGAFISARNSTIGMNALMYACRNGHTEVAKFLIEKGAKIDFKDKAGQTALIHAITSKKIDTAKFLIEKGADINLVDSNGNNALIYAVEVGNIEFVKYLVSKGADINAESEFGITALCRAACLKSTDIAKFLIERGANIDGAKIKKSDHSPLQDAVYLGNMDMVKLLVNNGANVNLKNASGNSIIYFAVCQNRTEILKFLLGKNILVDALTTDNISPAMIATIKGNKEILKLLISHGADISLKSKSGKAAIDYATKPEIKQLLKNSKSVS